MSAKLVIVHGVQTGDDEDSIKGPKKMSSALKGFVDGGLAFSTDYPAYEKLNDEAQEKFRTISKLILRALKTPVSGVFDSLVDLVGDVFVYLDNEDGQEIRKHVRATIENNPNCVLVGHSLGSVVCFDIIMELANEGFFTDKPIDEWPVKSLITFGSPLNLSLFGENRQLLPHGGNGVFQWYNYSDRNDPVISGNIFGKAFQENRLMRESYETFPDQYHIHDRQVETGFHVLAHINYWKNKYIVRRLAQQLS